MSKERPAVLIFLAFATSLGALAVAAVAASIRCGRGSACSTELALSIVAIAPACLIALLMVLLLRTKADVRWVRTLLLAGGVGVAMLPLGAFLLRDAKIIPLFAALVVAMVVLVLWGDRSELEPELEPESEPGRTPGRSGIGPPPSAPAREATLPPATSPGTSVRYPQAAGRPPAQEVLAVLREVATLSDQVIRFCELLTRLDPAPPSPTHRTPPYR